MRALLLLPLATLAFLVPSGSAGAAASRACTADDLQGARAPASINDYGLDTQPEPLIAGKRYRVVVVPERAAGDRGAPADGSVTVTAPDGPQLTQTTEDGRPAYDFTPDGDGKVRLVVSWEQRPYDGSDTCGASQAFDLPVHVLVRTRPTVKGSFKRGGSAFGSQFALKIHGEAPQEPGKVTVVVRARRGTTKPPSSSGKALGTFNFEPDGNGGFMRSGSTKRLKGTLEADSIHTGVSIEPYGNIAFGRTLRFAFSMEVLQDGRRIGGMRAGASCRRIQFRHRSAVLCHPVGLRQSP